MMELIKELDKDELPHVLFLDLFMPRLNGWEIIEKLQGFMEESGWFPSIYMLTSSVNHSDKKQADNQKYLTAFVNKPITLMKLKPLLQNEFNTRFPTSQF